MRHNEPALVAGVLLSFAALIAVLTFRLSPVARLVPIYVVVPTLVLLVLCLVRDLRRTGSSSAPNGRPGEVAPIVSNSEFRVLAWIFSLPILTLLIGLAPAVLLYTLAYLRSWLKLTPLRAAAIAAVPAAAVYGMSSIATNQRALEGWIWTALGGLL